MDNFPIANSFIRKSYILNDKVRNLLPLFEEALDWNQKVRQELRDIQPELKAMEFQSAICDQVITVSLAGQNTAILASKYVANCYNKIVHMEQLINDVEIGKILNYTVKCKEEETLREITLIKKSFNEEAKQLDILEGRSVVKNLRQLQIHQEMSQNFLAVLEREVYKMETQMLNKIKDAKDYRNKQIVHILENKKLIDSLEAKSPSIAGSQSRMDSKRRKRPSIPPKGSPSGSILQPALDFLSKFMQFKTNDSKTPNREQDVDETESEQEMVLQSILHRRKRVPSPAKQVRFVASPDLESVHIVNRLSSISTDDGSVARADSEPDSGNGSKKSSQMEGLIEEMEECENWKDAISKDDGQEVEYGELTLMESDGKESSDDEKAGSVGAGKKESTQAKKLPQVDVKGNVKKSQEEKKVEVLNVMIIPPAGGMRSFTPENGGSKYGRFKLTASQKTNSDAMDVDEDETDRLSHQFKQDKYRKTEDGEEEENTIEFPMAQPKPTQFKPPAPMAVSPPSSDQADSMLNFSEQNCEFNDDFWLSNTDDNNTNNAGHFYNL